MIASTVNPDVQLKWCVLITLISNSLETLSIARSGTVESRIRQLVMKLEYVDSLTLAHPFVKGFDQASYCLSEEELRTVAQGEIPDAIAKRKKEDIEGKEGASPVYSTTFFIGLAIEPKQRNHISIFLILDPTQLIYTLKLAPLVLEGLIFLIPRLSSRNL